MSERPWYFTPDGVYIDGRPLTEFGGKACAAIAASAGFRAAHEALRGPEGDMGVPLAVAVVAAGAAVTLARLHESMQTSLVQHDVSNEEDV